ncbi:uncharacterized protein LOC126755635 isoform X1 [Bactrocera neohumeralis]|uniref:uncharacterized protein LOC126755635 isoform X1 n=1 Tax=Bactrocera neohumeralis TaxID=98809 RepID=UPI002165D0AB|nr:uncharacterized protein LOC126755635 isoform X1 [Bactrocera neohumeralis]
MYKLSIILLSLLAGTAFGASTNNLLRSTEINLLQLMVDTRANQRANPEQSLACFDYYLKVFDDLNEEYRLGFAACLDTAEDDRSKVDAATQPERDAIEASAKSSCEALNACAQLVGSIEYFSCFSSTGKDNTESMYEISADAGETLANVRESYRLIENAEHRCTNASEREYVENTYKANLDLQSCLRGESAVPTTVAPTPTSPSETSPGETESTAAPTESTPGTPEPTGAPTESTTGAPEETESTAAPTESTPGTPEPTGAPTESTTGAPGETESTAAPTESTSDTPEPTGAPTESTTGAPAETDSTAAPTESTSDAPAVTEDAGTTTNSDFMPEEDLFAMRKLLAKLKSRLAVSKH